MTGDHLNLSRNDQRKALSEKSHSANPLNFSLACDGLIHRIVRKKIGINVIHTKLIFDTGESHACHRTVKYRNINRHIKINTPKYIYIYIYIDQQNFM